MSSKRLDTGGTWIDRDRAIGFTFDGHPYRGFHGDTLASALLANGVMAAFRSPILGRPRGVMSDGPEEPNGFVAVRAPWVDVIVAAPMVPLVEGLIAESRAGVGTLADADPVATHRSRHVFKHVETLIVGGGREGCAAARDAAASGDRVLLAEERSRLDGEAPEGAEVVTLTDATVLGLYDEGYAVIHERSRPVERLWHVRARHTVLATGAIERPIAFAGNDRPGALLASSAARYAERYGVLVGARAIAVVTNDWGREAAERLRDAGAELVEVVDARDGRVLTGTSGEDGAIGAVTIREADGTERVVAADVVVVSGGWTPNLTLWRAIGGGLRYDAPRACFIPELSAGPPWLSVVGSAAGEVPSARSLPYVEHGDDAEKFVDLQRDQTVADIASAVDAGLRSVEHVKRATYIGTAVDQGRTSGVIAAEIVNAMRGDHAGAQGPTSARPPVSPVSYSVLAGSDRGDLIDPVRTTPIQGWHLEHGAMFENVGQWKRPRYFPHAGEDMDAAVARECTAVRTGVGVLDATTLGKIEVTGPDAGVFLDRMYTNRMSSLGAGRIRYGLMLGLDGMVMDDGVAMRLADDRYLVFTTTGGAAAVLDHLEEWLQTEWPELRVYCTSVTEQWADVAVAGPRAGDVMAAVGADVDPSPEGFPFMTVRDGTVAGVPARIARVSFTGELSYEVTVAAWHGRHVWDAVMAAGAPFGITPYGTEAMHLLRAEKGFPIVGQETDGTVTPDDLGMSWVVDGAKGDFVGKRSLGRPDCSRPDRKQLVGLLPTDPGTLLPEGAQLVLEDTGQIPMPMAGHVTSSYRSAALGRTFALAMLSGGRALHGITVFAPLPGGTITAEVTSPVFWDPENRRRDGDPDGGAE